jgi:hypothetical protein
LKRKQLFGSKGLPVARRAGLSFYFPSESLTGVAGRVFKFAHHQKPHTVDAPISLFCEPPSSLRPIWHRVLGEAGAGQPFAFFSFQFSVFSKEPVFHFLKTKN